MVSQTKPVSLRHAAKAQIEPDALRWAMERSRVDANDLAKSVGTSHKVIRSWLEGTRKPSFRQARLAANRTRIPFGFLFLRSIPPVSLPIPDFRVVSGTEYEDISVDLRDVIHSTLRKQSWLSEYLEIMGAEESNFVGAGNISDSVDDLAIGISSALRLSTIIRSGKPEDYLQSLVQQSEQIGINVIRSGIVGHNTHRSLDIKEFRGFALSDKYAPFIFLNNVDSKRAQIFTLIHEMCHLWCKQSGISDTIGNIDDTLSSENYEAKCNQVAAEVLVPDTDLVHHWKNSKDGPLVDVLEILAGIFKVSRLVILFKLRKNSLISQQNFRECYDQLNISYKNDQNNLAGGNFYNNIIVRNGRLFTKTVLNATLNQHLLLRDAATLLEITPSQVMNLRDRLV